MYLFPFAPLSAESPQTSPEMVLLGEFVQGMRVFKKKTSFSVVCINVLHQVDKKALCSISVLK